MTPSEELVTQDEAFLAATRGGDDFDVSDLQIPIVKIGQPLTAEVVEGDARPGDFISSLTGEALGSSIELIVCQRSKGRFKVDRQANRTFVAHGALVPDSWEPDPFVGQPFSEHPESEEQFKARVNAKEHDWGKGPPISTTYNYTGYIPTDDEDERNVPVRLSLMRTQVKAARKLNTIIDLNLRQMWDSIFELSTTSTQNASGQTYYIPVVKKGRKTTPEERTEAVALAHVLVDGQVEVVGEPGEDSGSGEAPATPKGAIDV